MPSLRPFATRHRGWLPGVIALLAIAAQIVVAITV
jgi:hypothetical protein